jgi:hypothetical protein
MYKSMRQCAVLCVLLPLLAACATGPTYDQLHASEPPVAQTMGRFYMYRTSAFGAAVQPAIKVNGAKVGDAVPDGYFYVDEAPGSYTVSTTTEKDESIPVTLNAGQVRYIRFDISMGVFVGHVIPSIIDPEQGAVEIKSLHYTGGSAPKVASK